MQFAHLSEEAKFERLQQAEAHLQLAKVEREWYNSQIADCKTPTTSGGTKMHYSFDYAQPGTFPQQSTAARASLLPNCKEVSAIWSSL